MKPTGGQPGTGVWHWLLLVGLLLLAQAVQAATAARPDFDHLFAGFAMPMLLVDPVSGKIIDANPAAARFYGYSQAVLCTMTMQAINAFTPEQIALERADAASQGRDHLIFRHRLAQGEMRMVEVHTRPFRFAERTLELSIITDITPERYQSRDLWRYQKTLEEMVDAQVKQIEQARQRQVAMMTFGLLLQTVVIGLLLYNSRKRRQLQQERERLVGELQARNTELGRLGEAMAHHFQEPVRRLVSFAQRLQNKSSLVQDPDGRASLNFIHTQSLRLSTLVRDVQRYLELDQLKLEDEPTDSAKVLTRAIEATGLSQQPVCQIVIAPKLPNVTFSSKRLLAIFVILLDNAWRYRRPEVELRIEISAQVANQRAGFRFADNGSGIAPEYREQVFGLFNRLVPNSDSSPGTGMGLALLRKSIQHGGGSVHIEDGIAGGTCFVFDLPV